ncbi:MAG: mannose-1-phosphate guanylyltransferase [Treponema sp.]|nr:mannose-1-phosphate guanylyltransferase [Treponema sp.]
MIRNMFDDCLIMAGGAGTRLWPASNSGLPKQFLPVYGKKSFFSLALERALEVTGSGQVIIITGKSFVPHVIEETARFSAAKKKRFIVIGEPVAKNTAPAIACAVVYSNFCGCNSKMLVLTSDHIIKPLETFKNDVFLAASAVGTGKLAVFGIPPAGPETGFGYIEAGKKNENVYTAAAFHEKPDLKTAKKYAASKRFFWNSGMFAFSCEFMAQEFSRLAPDVISPFNKLKIPKPEAYTEIKGVKILSAWPGLDNAYRKTKSISFDYAVAEKCGNTVMVRASFNWIDIGNWEEYAKICGGKDAQIFNAGSENCYVDSDIPVALAGVEDLIIVIRSGKNGSRATALITRKGQTQKVRDVVDLIKKAGRSDLL